MKNLMVIAALVCVAMVYSSCTKNNDVKPSNAVSHFSGKVVAVDTSGGEQPIKPPR